MTTSREYREAHPQLSWRSTAGIRDRLIHDYVGEDFTPVWDVVRNRIPEVHAAVTRLLAPDASDATTSGPEAGTLLDDSALDGRAHAEQ